MSEHISILVEDTPNPLAWKFIVNRPVLMEGKASFATKDEAFGNRLATDLLDLEGVKQVHFFSNVITVTGRFDSEPEILHPQIKSVIETRMPAHNPSFGVQESKKAKRANLSPEVQQIEEILDRTIRPGLQGDGGDIEVVNLEGNKLYIHYEGACGTCPSSTAGTLMAIEGILRDEFKPDLDVIPI